MLYFTRPVLHSEYPVLSDELRKRLAGMSRTVVSSETDSTDLSSGSPFRERLLTAARAFEDRKANIPAATTMEAILGGREMETAAGKFFLVEPDPESLHPDIATLISAHQRLRPESPVAVDPVLADYSALRGVQPEGLLYLDIETTGFTGVPLFLIGLMYFDDNRIKVSQLLARDYSEEAAVLAYLAARLADFDCLVTFNGKTFDAPFIRDRYFAHAVRCRFPAGHLDLLGVSRKRWRGKLPDCRLQTLERWVCGRSRDGDIPGVDIPDTYHLFVRTGNANLVKPILEHNALDLITMADLLGRLLDRNGGEQT